MFYVHSVLFLVRWLAIGVLAVDLSLVFYILYRRAARNRYYAAKDAAQRRFEPVARGFAAGKMTVRQAADLLRTRTPAEREAVKVLLLAALKTADRERVSDLLAALGYVDEWSIQAFGRRRAQELRQLRPGQLPPLAQNCESSGWARTRRRVRRLRVFAVSRALAVSWLGNLAPRNVSVLLKEALNDPSPYVCRMSVAALGRNHVSEGVELLLEELRKSVGGESEVPVRSVKTALVRHSLDQVGPFAPYLKSPNSRVRFLAVDTIREICRRTGALDKPGQNLPAAVGEWFLHDAVHDGSADVRARSATVIAYFRNPAAITALRSLLQDENEFVRLHAVRSCADPYYTELMADLAPRVRDACWRVREAAVRTLAKFPGAGWRQLETTFLESADRYASEQIAEELQRSGLLPQLVSRLAAADGERRLAVDLCSRMVRLGMDSPLTDMLVDHCSAELRTELFELLRDCETPQFTSVLQVIAARQADPLQMKARQLLEMRRARTAAAGV